MPDRVQEWIELVGGPVAAGGRLIVALCAMLVLMAVALNFATANRGQTKEGKRTPVATGTMLAFFAAFTYVLSRKIGMLDVGEQTKTVLVVVGSILAILGCAVNVLGRRNLGLNWANHVKVYEDHTLVTTGVFGFVRHPLYASLMWLGAGAAMVYLNWLGLVLLLAVFVPAMTFRARQEEALLSHAFPDYDAYKKRVGMFLPRWPKK